jgi:hypothetical protein
VRLIPRAVPPHALRVTSTLFSVLDGAAFVFGVLVLVTGSLTPLSLLVADMAVMWAIAIVRHARGPEDRSPPRRPIAT